MRMMVLVGMIGALTLVATVHAMPGQKGERVSTSAVGAVPAGPVSTLSGANGADAVPQGMAGVIQDVTLPGYKEMKVGEAFGRYRYFKKKVWSEARGANGNYYVDFIGSTPAGWFDFKSRKEGISARGVEVKFVIHSDGVYGVGMVSKIEVKPDGKTYRYPLADTKRILDAIYANRKISF